MPVDPVVARCSSLVKVYRTATGEVHALRGVDAAFFGGRVTAVVGPSGSGKSSLLRILAGLDHPTAGSVIVADRDLSELGPRGRDRLRRESVGYVFQHPADNLVPHLDALGHLKWAERVHGESGDPAAALGDLGLEERLTHRPSQLSGGEQQRLAFAQAVVGRPDLVVADEPTAELDHSAAARVLDGVRRLAQSGTGFVIATHDPQVVNAADAVIELSHGAVTSEQHGTGASYAVIDAAGRVQLPEGALSLFPERRAVLRVTEDGVTLDPP